MLGSELVQSWHYSDDGPPPGVQRLRTPLATAAKGWISVARRTDDNPMVSHDVIYSDGESVTRSGIMGDVGRGDRARGDQTYANLPHDEAAQRRHADSVAYGAAHAAEADLLVTTRPFLLTGKWFPGHGIVCCRPRDGVALLGQFLRSRGEFMIGSPFSDAVMARTDKGLFHWVGARALLPAGWRWQHERPTADASPASDTEVLAVSVFQRVARCLAARDLVRWLLYLPQDNTVIDDLIDELDGIFVNLVGAYDVHARVVHRRLFGSEQSERGAGWQKTDRWLQKVGRQVPALERLMAPETSDADLLKIITALRNTVHNVPLQALGRQSLGVRRQAETAIRLPRQEADEIVEILERRGWADLLGLEDWGDGGFLVSPLRLVEHVIPAAAMTINKLMTVPLGPPSEDDRRTRHVAVRSDPNHHVFSDANQRAVLLQLGIDDQATLVCR